MGWQFAGSLALLLLTGAAPGPCGPRTNSQPGDQASGTLANTGLGVPSFSAADRTRLLPANDLTAKPDATTGEVLHGLPSPEALRPIDQPRRPPVYR